MTPQELAKLMHEAHFDLRFSTTLDSDFGFLYMGWESTHMKYQGELIAIAEQMLRRTSITEKGRNDNE